MGLGRTGLVGCCRVRVPELAGGSVGAYDAAAGQYILFGGAGNGAGPPAGARGSNGSTIGGADRVLGDTFALSAGPPVGLGTPTNAVPPAGYTAPGPLPPPGAAAPSGSGFRPARGPQAATPRPGRAIASPLRVLRPGQLVTLRGSGFSGGAKVTVTFHSTPSVVGTTRASSDGTFDLTVAVPQSATAGTHRFIASGTGPTDPVKLLVATVKVVASAPAPGGGTGTAERAALLCLAVAFPAATWLAMEARSRRRRGRPANG